MRIINKFLFGKTSTRRKETTSKHIQKCLDLTISRCPIDITIPWMGGRRTADQQNIIFKKGNSKADGYNKLSNHQILDKIGLCKAVDVVPYVSGRAEYTAYGRFGIIGTLMLDSWEELKSKGEIPSGLHLHWGGLWSNKDRNKKQLGWDMAHYEIRDYPQNINLK